CHRDGTLRAGLQPDARDEHRRRQTAHCSDRGIAGSGASLTGRLHCPDPHRGTQMPMAFIHVENSPSPMTTQPPDTLRHRFYTTKTQTRLLVPQGAAARIAWCATAAPSPSASSVDRARVLTSPSSSTSWL